MTAAAPIAAPPFGRWLPEQVDHPGVVGEVARFAVAAETLPPAGTYDAYFAWAFDAGAPDFLLESGLLAAWSAFERDAEGRRG